MGLRAEYVADNVLMVLFDVQLLDFSFGNDLHVAWDL